MHLDAHIEPIAAYLAPRKLSTFGRLEFLQGAHWQLGHNDRLCSASDHALITAYSPADSVNQVSVKCLTLHQEL